MGARTDPRGGAEVRAPGGAPAAGVPGAGGAHAGAATAPPPTQTESEPAGGSQAEPRGGPCVLVTGGGRGIGRAIALRFAGVPGARIVVAARTLAELEAVAEECVARGARALAVPMDVSDLASVEEGVARTLAFTEGRLEVLVNNAGVFDVRPFGELSPATWYRHVAVNLNGPFHVTLLALKGLEASGRAHVFNVSSTAGLRPFPGNTAYCATKYGLRGFSDALRLDLAERGVRVSTVYPGGTDTSIFDGVPGEWDRSRMNRPEDVAEVVWEAWRTPDGGAVDDLEVPPPTEGPSSG